jgi:hypothetical protein
VGRAATSGWKTESRKSEMITVGQAHADTMGRPGVFSLWILGSRYSDINCYFKAKVKKN